MKKVALTELDPRLQKQVAMADQQIRSNPQYAVEILTGILSRNPGCVEVRRSLRQAQKAVLGTRKGLFDGVVGAITSSKIAKAVEADPVGAITGAEAALAKKPTDANANKTIALAATKLGFHALAAFAYEELAANDPKEVQHHVDLANTWIAGGEYDNALHAADAGLRLFPGNGDLQEAVRRASVSKTMKKGNWEDKGDFQSKLKDKDEALRLEQAARKGHGRHHGGRTDRHPRPEAAGAARQHRPLPRHRPPVHRRRRHRQRHRLAAARPAHDARQGRHVPRAAGDRPGRATLREPFEAAA
ncbi:MAG: hypothetical protein ACKORB_05300 [Opitutia bacterium]